MAVGPVQYHAEGPLHSDMQRNMQEMVYYVEEGLLVDERVAGTYTSYWMVSLCQDFRFTACRFRGLDWYMSRIGQSKRYAIQNNIVLIYSIRNKYAESS